MSLQSTLVQKYYNNLEYHKIHDNASLKNQINSIKIKLQEQSLDSQDIEQRVLKTIHLIEYNKQLFNSAFDHVDLVNIINNYLRYISSEFIYVQEFCPVGLSSKFDKELFKNIWNAIYTLFNIITNNDIQLFLHAAIIESSIITTENNYDYYEKIHKDNYKELYSCLVFEMIIFKDSDVYAAVNQLKRTEVRLNKIWIQEPVQAKFVWILRKYFQRTFRRLIRVFRTKEELLITNDMHKINIISIWSEDIVTAKNLAASLNSDIIFINTHMDFSDCVVLLPYNKIFDAPLYDDILHNKMKGVDIRENINDTDISKTQGPTYDMYYDGTWQKPVKGKYWISNDHCLWANATIEDVHRCIDSAKRGFEIWSTWYIDSRIETLSNLASVLKYKGKSKLAEVVMSWVHLPQLENILSENLQSGRLDITTFCEPRGVIVLECYNDISLFSELIQSLVMGNSVIILCNRFSYALAPYYDIFSISQIPPGVINVLSCENMNSFVSYSNVMQVKQIMSYITRQRKVILPLE